MLLGTLRPARGRPEFWAALWQARYLQFDYHTILTLGNFFFRFGAFIEDKIISIDVSNYDGVFRATLRFYDYKTHGCKV